MGFSSIGTKDHVCNNKVTVKRINCNIILAILQWYADHSDRYKYTPLWL